MAMGFFAAVVVSEEYLSQVDTLQMHESIGLNLEREVQCLSTVQKSMKLGEKHTSVVEFVSFLKLGNGVMTIKDFGSAH